MQTEDKTIPTDERRYSGSIEDPPNVDVLVDVSSLRPSAVESGGASERATEQVDTGETPQEDEVQTCAPGKPIGPSLAAETALSAPALAREKRPLDALVGELDGEGAGNGNGNDDKKRRRMEYPPNFSNPCPVKTNSTSEGADTTTKVEDASSDAPKPQTEVPISVRFNCEKDSAEIDEKCEEAGNIAKKEAGESSSSAVVVEAMIKQEVPIDRQTEMCEAKAPSSAAAAPASDGSMSSASSAEIASPFKEETTPRPFTDSNSGPRWRTHQMADDYISLAGDMMYPSVRLGPFGYDPAHGLYPIERVAALGVLTSSLRRPSVVEKWSPYEIAVFESALSLYGKHFHQVQKVVRTKTCKEIVEFYYIWKKTSHYRVWKKQYEPDIPTDNEED